MQMCPALAEMKKSGFAGLVELVAGLVDWGGGISGVPFGNYDDFDRKYVQCCAMSRRSIGGGDGCGGFVAAQ